MVGDNGNDVLLGDEARFVSRSVIVLERVGVLSAELASFGAAASSAELADARAVVEQPVLALFGMYERDGTRVAGSQWPVSAATLRLLDVVANDELFGGAGSDLLVGQQGDDVLTGDDGDDVLVGDMLDLEFALKTLPTFAGVTSLNVVRLFGGAAPTLTLMHAATTMPSSAATSAGWPATGSLGNVGVATLMPDVVLHAAAEADVIAGGAVGDAIDRSVDVTAATLSVAHRIVGLGLDAATTLAAFVGTTPTSMPASGLRSGLAALATTPLRALTALVATDVRHARSATALAHGNDNLLGGDGADLVVGDNVVAHASLGSSALANVANATTSASPLLIAIQRAASAATSVAMRVNAFSGDVARIQVCVYVFVCKCMCACCSR